MTPLLVVCSGTSWDGVPLPDRMLSNELLAYARILWVDPPVSLVTRSRHRSGARRSMVPALSRPVPGLVRLTPTALPLHTRRGIRVSTRALVRSQIRWALRRLGEQPHAVLDCRLGRLLGGWGPQVRDVLYGTDDYVAGAKLMGLDVAAVERDEQATVAAADLVLAVSQPLADRWRGMGARVEFLPNGVAAQAYRDVETATPAAGVSLPAPVVGVVGHLSDRIDIDLLEAIPAAGLSLLLVGPWDRRWEPERFPRLVARPGVAWVGPQPFDTLPGYYRHIDVGITPYTDSEFNRASFPLKTLEYLAAGRAVVSADLPATRWLGTDLIRVADGPRDFVAAVREAAAQPRTAELVSARRAVAERHSWRARAAQAAPLLGLA
jgi:teichuronic acid biosynthesis glycosyltransferase TuaH